MPIQLMQSAPALAQFGRQNWRLVFPESLTHLTEKAPLRVGCQTKCHTIANMAVCLEVGTEINVLNTRRWVCVSTSGRLLQYS